MDWRDVLMVSDRNNPDGIVVQFEQLTDALF
jgi:hypothetical protein